MKLTDAEVRELFQRKTARNGTSECLNEEVLIHAAAGTLGGAERERISSHIARCSDCAQEFRIARTLVPIESAARRELAHPQRMAWLAVAASVLLAVALPAIVWMLLSRQRDGATIAALRNQVAALESRPPVVTTIVDERPLPLQIDVPIVDLDSDVTRGASEGVTTISVPKSTDVFTLILHLPDETGAPIDVEVLDSAGGVLATKHLAAEGSQRGSITLALHRKLIPSGAHTIRARMQGKDATFRFRIDYP